MINTLPLTAPGVDAAKVVVTGATQLRKVFTSDQVPGIIAAYMQGINVAFALPIAGNGIACVLGLLILIRSRESLKPEPKTDRDIGNTV